MLWCSVLLAVTFRMVTGVTDRPIIGIMTMELEKSLEASYPGYDVYIAASYVKAVEGAGARVVPVFTGQSESYYRKIAQSVNGILIPGGGAQFSGTDNFYAATKTMYNIALEMNGKKIHFPILAVCLGYQLIAHLANNDKSLLKRCDIIHTNMNLKFLPGFRKGSLLKSIPKQIARALEGSNITVHNHNWCIYPDDFSAALDKDWKILATTDDLQGVPFISAYEHRKHPIGAVLFHPEKNIYEWGRVLNFPRSPRAIAASRYFYDWLVGEAKKNDNYFSELHLEQESLIYNFEAFHSELFYPTTHSNFTHTYLFNTKYLDVK
ncbi:unnamed protein product [Bemisia tabaci]|uniref:folate gamma-glutamyl hydrolase n=1 Tax=Bemisia tabaci TaxID=7038 RepID=A0A9P0AMK6_BEMTA|nr:unnamed protein product [Bemisia tabaci]